MISPGTITLARDVSGSNVQIRSAGTDADNLATVDDGALVANNILRGYDGATFDRVHAHQWNADSLSPQSAGGLIANAILRVYDGTNFNLARGSSNNSDGVSVSATNNILGAISLIRGFNGSTQDRLRSGGNNADGVSTITLGNLLVKAHQSAYNGTTWDLIKSSSATNHASSAGSGLVGVQLERKPADWSVINFPATDTTATATKAAGGAGVRHVLTGFCFSLSGASGTATALLRCDILDGASQIFSAVLSAPANTTKTIEFDNLSLLGTANTAMIIQFSAAGGAGTQEAVSMFGYSVS